MNFAKFFLSQNFDFVLGSTSLDQRGSVDHREHRVSIDHRGKNNTIQQYKHDLAVQMQEQRHKKEEARQARINDEIEWEQELDQLAREPTAEHEHSMAVGAFATGNKTPRSLCSPRLETKDEWGEALKAQVESNRYRKEQEKWKLMQDELALEEKVQKERREMREKFLEEEKRAMKFAKRNGGRRPSDITPMPGALSGYDDLVMARMDMAASMGHLDTSSGSGQYRSDDSGGEPHRSMYPVALSARGSYASHSPTGQYEIYS